MPHDVKAINEEEIQLDQYIATMQEQLTKLNNSQDYLDYCYITEEDIKLMSDSSDEALLVIRAPVGTLINVDEKDENYIITLNGDSEEITTQLVEKEHHIMEIVSPKIEDIQNISNLAVMFGKS
jgi:hypothetical protein